MNKTTLTTNQIALLQALADGETTVSYAQKTNRARNTLKQTLMRIRDRLGADTTVHAVAMAMRRGYIK